MKNSEACRRKPGNTTVHVAASRSIKTLRPKPARLCCSLAARLLLLSTLLALNAVGLLLQPTAAWALCGDLSSDGFVTSSDALAALQKAVAGNYDARGDIDSGSGSDSLLLAGDALALLKAAVAGNIPACAAARATHAAVLTASFRFDASGLALIDFDSLEVRFRGGVFHRDSVLRTQGGRLFGVNRLGANSIQEIDFTSPELSTLKECSVSGGFGSNTHDLLLLSAQKGYVTAYGGSELLIVDPRSLDPEVDPACAGMVTGSIDLSALADADGIPEMDQMTIAEGQVFVSLQTLVHSDFFPPAGAARVAVIDPQRDSVAGFVQLELENPFAETKGLIYLPDAGLVYLGGPGQTFLDFDDGGIEAVDVATLSSKGLLISGAELGGDLFDFVVVGSRRAYAVVAEPGGANVLLEVDLEAGRVTDELIRSSALVDIPIADIELNEDGKLWVAFREDLPGSRPGIRIFSIADNSEITDEPIFPGDLPFNIVFVEMP